MRNCRRCKESFKSNNDSKICDECKTKCSQCSTKLTTETQDYTSLHYRKNYLCKLCVASSVRKTKCPIKRRDYDLYRYYKITLLQYELLLETQLNKCKICQVHTDNLNSKLHVDHCHTTGKIRGLLCGNCNLGLGSFKDNTKLLEFAITYLKDNYG